MTISKDVKPKISIIIPTIGRVFELKRCLGAITSGRGFDVDNVEVIVIDDANCLDIKEICIKDKFRYIGHLSPTGQSVSKNEGVQYANGEYVAFIDDDCVPEPNWLSGLVKIIKKEKNMAVVGGKINNLGKIGLYNPAKIIFYPWFKKEFSKTGNIYLFGLTSTNFDSDISQQVSWVSAGNMMVRKDVFLSVGGFSTKLIGHMKFEESVFCSKVTRKGFKVFYCSEAVCNHLRSNSGRKIKAIVNFSGRYNEVIMQKDYLKSIKDVYYRLLLILLFYIYHILDSSFRIFTLDFPGLLGKISALSISH